MEKLNHFNQFLGLEPSYGIRPPLLKVQPNKMTAGSAVCPQAVRGELFRLHELFNGTPIFRLISYSTQKVFAYSFSTFNVQYEARWFPLKLCSLPHHFEGYPPWPKLFLFSILIVVNVSTLSNNYEFIWHTRFDYKLLWSKAFKRQTQGMNKSTG